MSRVGEFEQDAGSANGWREIRSFHCGMQVTLDMVNVRVGSFTLFT